LLTQAYQSATTRVLSDKQWLDIHFEACRPEYEAAVAGVGFIPGSSVLDAGCGPGSFLPLLKAAVGPEGCVFALDFSAANVASISDPYRDTAALASVEALPYADASFDAVWCANVSQYFDDEPLLAVLRELKRVVRRGGIVAVKDVDMLAFRFGPADPFLVAHLSEVGWRDPASPPEARGSLRGRELRRSLKDAGLSDVRQHSSFIERWAPLRPVEAELWSAWLVYLAKIAEERRVPEADLEEWQALTRDGALPFVSRPDFYCCEAQVVAVGRVE
jgi:SAM-dependent methyltransferase